MRWDWERILINQPQAQLKKIDIRYNTSSKILSGLKFYFKDGAIIFEDTYGWDSNDRFKTHTVHLDDGERVIGYKSTNLNHAYHENFQLIIGRLV